MALSVRAGRASAAAALSVTHADTGWRREGAAGPETLRHNGGMTADLLARARAGDADAFGELVGPYRRELEVHCYRILGSATDAEDALQEALLAAWQGLGSFEERASVRTWLYRIATTRSLNALRSARRRPQTDWPPPGINAPEPTRLGETPWLEPYPDILLEGLADAAAGPEARYEASEAISLAFITALQTLPPRQRAVLILRDVLDFPAREVAHMLGDTTEESIKSALKRARATLERQLPSSDSREPPPPAGSAVEKDLVERLTRAYENGDVDGLVALLTEDVLMTMPPIPLEYLGRELVARFLRAAIFLPGIACRPVPARANGQPALVMYFREPSVGYRAGGMLVFGLSGGRVSAITRFDESVLPRFGVPATLPPSA